MKTFKNQNYYEILQVPANAHTDEIKQAYREALAMYDEQSVATYALFSDEQRQELLQTIEIAFDHLINEDKRAAYNRMLIDTGQMAAAVFSRQDQRKLAAGADARSTSREENLGQWVSKQGNTPEIRQHIESMLAADEISGRALKQLREAYGIEISEIYAITRISGDTLKRIEADRYDDLPAEIFLKQFLKTYADLLQIDSEHVIAGYIKRMTQQTPGP